VVVGHHQAARPGQVDLVLPVRDHRHLQPLCARLDAGPGRAGPAGRAAVGRHDHQAAGQQGSADHPRRPRHLDASKPVAFLLADLGVTKSHSRPHTSNDNPYSESQFKTLKHRPEFPDRFGCLEDAHAFCGRFFRWYNDEHRHSGIGFHTPADVHYGRAELVRAQRATVLDAAYAAHPERFVRKPPAPPELPTAAWINKPEEATLDTTNP
jgi:Integrase core domain